MVVNPAPRLSIETQRRRVYGAAPADAPTVRIPKGSGLGNDSNVMSAILGGAGNPAWDGGPLPRPHQPAPPKEPEPEPWQPPRQPWNHLSIPLIDISEPDPVDAPPATEPVPTPRQQQKGWYSVPGAPGMRVFSPKLRKGRDAVAAREKATETTKTTAPPPSPRLSAKAEFPYWQRLHPPPSPRPNSARPNSARPASKRGAFPKPDRPPPPGVMELKRGAFPQPEEPPPAPSARPAPPAPPTVPPSPRVPSLMNTTVLSSGELDRMVRTATTLAAHHDAPEASVRAPVLAWADPINDPANAPPTNLVDELPLQLRNPTAWVGSVVTVGEQPPDTAQDALQAATLRRRERVFPAAKSEVPLRRPTKRVATIPGVRSQHATLRSVMDLDGTGEVRLQPTRFFEMGGTRH